MIAKFFYFVSSLVFFVSFKHAETAVLCILAELLLQNYAKIRRTLLDSKIISWLLKLARVLVRFDHVASLIVNANHGVM